MHKLIAVALLATAAFGPAHANINFKATLSSDQEVAPPEVFPSDGTGFGTAVYHPGANTLAVSLDFANLEGTTVDGHIHCCAPPTANASVAIGFTSTGFPLGVTAGSYSNVFNLLDSAIYTPAFLMAGGGTAAGARDRLINGMENGLAYFNVHTTFRPAGEIRGNITVPAPANLALFGLGIAGVALARRRA